MDFFVYLEKKNVPCLLITRYVYLDLLFSQSGRNKTN